MHRIALTLSVLSSIIHGRRVQTSVEKSLSSQEPLTLDDTEHRSSEPATSDVSINLAKLLLGLNHAAAFLPSGATISRAGLPDRNPRTAGSHPVELKRPNAGGRSVLEKIRMQQAAGFVDTLARRGEDTELEINTEFYNDKDNKKRLAKYKDRIERINALEDEIEQLSDDELRAKTDEFRKRLSEGETEDDILEEAFAVVREAAWRTLELRHYDVQLMGGLALHDGYLAQMNTGEGKTLTCTCPVYLNALSGKGAYLVTVNDYLARRDSEQMGQVYRFLGLSVGLIQEQLPTEKRRIAYSRDVIYVTNSQFGFDYLRDHLALRPEQTVLRASLNFCVIDEGDSVLVDEARTPLIIAGSTDAPLTYYQNAKVVAEGMEKDKHYTVDEKEVSVMLTDEGAKFAQTALNIPNLYDPEIAWAKYIQYSLIAKEHFKKDKSYVVRDGEAVIVDEFSGRVMEGRRWGNGLHQAVEAKEGLTIQPETEVIASITYQSLFRRFRKLSSMTGTAITEAQEFSELYKLQVVVIPTVLAKQRIDVPNGVYKTIRAKADAALNELMEIHNSGRPVLVGTTSVDISMQFSRKLTMLGVKHDVLNARPESVARESEIVAQAGRKGAVTIATNMAGRGTDILLGGSAGFMAQLKVREIIAAAAGVEVPTIQEDYWPCAVDKEALEWIEDAKQAFLVEAQASAIQRKKDNEAAGVDENTQKAAEAEKAARFLELDEMIAVAASSAPVKEDSATDIAREAILRVKETFDEILKPEREEVLQLGGLHVIGTSLHDSRRIDEQLRGRSGRQGDPGSSHFFISFEDKIFRIFGGDRVKDLLDFIKAPEGMALESDKVNEVVKDVQAQVEGYYYNIRKEMFDIDQVVTIHREKQYSLRDSVLREDEDTILKRVRNSVPIIVQALFDKNWQPEAPEEILKVLGGVFPGISITGNDVQGRDLEKDLDVATAAAQKLIDNKIVEIDSVRQDSSEPSVAAEASRYLLLTILDNMWTKHMATMKTALSTSAISAITAQENALKNYKEKGEEYYQKLLKRTFANLATSLLNYTPTLSKRGKEMSTARR